MKKFTFLGMVMLFVTTLAFSQNLVQNNSFENWTADQPDNWLADGGAITVSQNTETVQDGSSSCKVVWTSQDNQYLTSDSFTVEAGTPIVLSLYVYDNDPAGRARLCCIYEGADNYYGDYSEDMDEWQMLSFEAMVPDGATSAEFQIRFYDVSASWDDDAEVFVDNASFFVDNEIKPEPSNYPTEFSATAAGVSAQLSWTDAIGDQLPQGYLILASTSIDFNIPVDGVPQEDDSDLSDGLGAVNVNYGDESAFFSGTSPATTYYFVIVPYTNAGENIDYKVDGDPPSTMVTMPDISVISSVDFEDNTFGDWEEVSVTGDQVWEVATFGNPGNCAKMSGYDGQPYANEDWFISPALNMDNYTEESFSFDNAMNYSGPAMELYVSFDYSGDPATATWEMIDFNASGGNWDYVSSEIDLSAYSGTAHLGFKFTSTEAESATWELDNLLVTGVMSSSVDELGVSEISVYPNPGNGSYHITNVNNDLFELNVYNVLGQSVVSLTSIESIIDLDLTDEENGIYIIQIVNQNVTQTLSIIKK